MNQAHIDRSLDTAFNTYVRGWGPIPWRELVADVKPHPNAELAAMLYGLSGIEADAYYMQTKLRHSGLTREPRVRDFNAIWLVEELDHSRALRALHRLYKTGAAEPNIHHGTFRRDRRSIFSIPVLHLVRHYRLGALAAYFLEGAFTEYTAITIYKALGRLMEDSSAEEILNLMARQEGRHLKFYKAGLEATLDCNRPVQRFVRYVAHHVWRPPGIDLYGRSPWHERFDPLLRDAAIRNRLLQMDAFFASLPGLGDLHAMRQFLPTFAQLQPGLS